MASTELCRDLEISWASCPKWPSRLSAERVALVESIHGRLAVVMIDVQGSGSNGARKLALQLSSFCSELIVAGVDSVSSAEATHQHLLALRQGRVGASVHVIDVTLHEGAVHVSGFGPMSVASNDGSGWSLAQMSSGLAGHADSVPERFEGPDLASSVVLILANDGMVSPIRPFDELLDGAQPALVSADALLERSNRRDQGRSHSDKSVTVIRRIENMFDDRRQSGRNVFSTAGWNRQ